jgi:hypothetical protein
VQRAAGGGASPSHKHTAEAGRSLDRRLLRWAAPAAAPLRPDAAADVLSLRLVTWNSGNARPPASLAELFLGSPAVNTGLGLTMAAPAAEMADAMADVVVFGQQESTFNVEADEVRLAAPTALPCELPRVRLALKAPTD